MNIITAMPKNTELGAIKPYIITNNQRRKTMLYTKLTATEINNLNSIFDIVIENNNLKSFKIYDNNSDAVLYVSPSTYGNFIEISQPTKPEIEDRYQVIGKINGIDISPKAFETREEAERFQDKIDDGGKIQILKYNMTDKCYVFDCHIPMSETVPF